MPTFAWSDFARERYLAAGRHTWFDGAEAELIDLVRVHWPDRRPGAGRHDLEQVVVVPVPSDGFHGTTVLLDERTPLHARLDRRRAGEDSFIDVTADAEPEPVAHAAVVLYGAAALEENDGRRSSDADWEVVCLLAAAVPEEPMDPVTMARNFLQKPGGTFAPYTAQQFAEAIDYWNRHARCHDGRHARSHTEETP